MYLIPDTSLQFLFQLVFKKEKGIFVTFSQKEMIKEIATLHL